MTVNMSEASIRANDKFRLNKFSYFKRGFIRVYFHTKIIIMNEFIYCENIQNSNESEHTF